jgi:hypothetical protein
MIKKQEKIQHHAHCLENFGQYWLENFGDDKEAVEFFRSLSRKEQRKLLLIAFPYQKYGY